MKLGIELGIYQPKTCISIFFVFNSRTLFCVLWWLFPYFQKVWKPGKPLEADWWNCVIVCSFRSLCYNKDRFYLLPFMLSCSTPHSVHWILPSSAPCFLFLSYSMSPQFMKCVLYTGRLTAENEPISLVARTVDCDLLISRKSHLLGWTLGCKFVPLNLSLWYQEIFLSLEYIFQGKYVYFKSGFVLNCMTAFCI